MKLFLIKYNGDVKNFSKCFRCHFEITIQALSEEDAIDKFFEKQVPLMDMEMRDMWIKNMRVRQASRLNPTLWLIPEIKPVKFNNNIEIPYKKQIYIYKRKLIIRYVLLFASITLALYLMLDCQSILPVQFRIVPNLYKGMISNISSGYMVSWIFYLIIVYLPQKRRKNRIKGNLAMNFNIFKRKIIKQFLLALYGHFKIEVINENNLTEPLGFKNFFNHKVDKDALKNSDENEELSNGEWLSQYDNRLYALLDKMKPQQFQEIKLEIEIFNKNLFSTIESINIENKFVFDRCKDLYEAFYRLEKSVPNNIDGDAKIFMSRLLNMFSRWHYVEGQVNDDPVKLLIQEM